MACGVSNRANRALEKSPVDATSILLPKAQAPPARRRRLTSCIEVVLRSCPAVFTASSSPKSAYYLSRVLLLMCIELILELISLPTQQDDSALKCTRSGGCRLVHSQVPSRPALTVHPVRTLADQRF